MLVHLSVFTVTASRDFFQVPMTPGFLAAPTSRGRPEAFTPVYASDYAHPSVYQTPTTDGLLVRGRPFVESDPVPVDSQSMSSNLSDFLTTGSILSMFAIIGYAIGRKSSQNSDAAPQREQPAALELTWSDLVAEQRLELADGLLAVREQEAVAALGVMGRNAKPAPVKKSEALPWSDRPKSLEGTRFVGDSGFDPLGLFGADPLKLGWDQKFYREAELKHARLGMLAALAYPVQERLEPVLAKAFNLPDELKETLGRSPSIVNGGLEQGEIPLTIVAFLAGGAIVEYLTDKLKKEQGSSYVPGDVGLPYVNAASVEQQALRQLQELQLGRLAMVSVLVYVIEESVFKTSILRETVAIFQELANVKSLETDVANGVLGAEKGSSALLQELGNVKQLELDVASLSGKVTEFAKEGEELVLKDLQGK
jgi:light-harvesting complex II chlorophyll a/b binding protein 5